MAKDPAFLFYYQDFAYGTRKMTFEEKGCYIELLCEQADTGHLSLDDVKRILKNSFPIWERICSKFITDKDGLYFNEILDEHLEKRRKFTESRKKNLKGIHKETHMETHMEDVNEDVNVNVINDKDKQARSIFLSCWSYPLTTNYLLKLAKELIKEHGAKKVIEAANISAEYGKRSNFKYLKGVLNGMTKAEEISQIKDREQRAKEIKRQEKEFTPNPETAKIFRDMLDEMDKKKKSVQPDDSDLKKKNEEFRKKVEKGELK